jgi:hypothetical protein
MYMMRHPSMELPHSLIRDGKGGVRTTTANEFNGYRSSESVRRREMQLQCRQKHNQQAAALCALYLPPTPSVGGLAFAACAAAMPLLQGRDTQIAMAVHALFSEGLNMLWEPLSVFRHGRADMASGVDGESDNSISLRYNCVSRSAAAEHNSSENNDSIQISIKRIQHLFDRLEQVGTSFSTLLLCLIVVYLEIFQMTVAVLDTGIFRTFVSFSRIPGIDLQRAR